MLRCPGHLLVAVGRRPNTDDLGLDRAGVVTDAKGYIVVDDQCRTNVPGIWATGDVNGRGAFTHTSWNDFEVVAANLLDNDPRRISDRIPCYALFIGPPLGRALQAGAPYTAISRGMYIHPTVAEYLPTLLQELEPLAQPRKSPPSTSTAGSAATTS